MNDDEIRKKMAAAGFPIKDSTLVGGEAVTLPTTMTFDRQEMLKQAVTTTETLYNVNIVCYDCGDAVGYREKSIKEAMDQLIEDLDDPTGDFEDWKIINGKIYCGDCNP